MQRFENNFYHEFARELWVKKSDTGRVVNREKNTEAATDMTTQTDHCTTLNIF
jgi:hypothetical protein